MGETFRLDRFDEQFFFDQADVAVRKGERQSAFLVQLPLGSGAVQRLQRRADCPDALAVFLPQDFQLRLKAIGGETGGIVHKANLADVQLLGDDVLIQTVQRWSACT